jgi:DNA-binding MarR family transcriptional regulator
MKEPELSSSLRAVVSALFKGLRKQVSVANAFSMTEMDTIAHLYRSPSLLPTELAALTKVKTQSMSQILSKLERLNVICRTPSQEDKRKVAISLTPAGREMVLNTEYERDKWLKEVIEKKLTKEEKELLTKALPVLHKLL